jgi:gliding motility-associated-like protein
MKNCLIFSFLFVLTLCFTNTSEAQVQINLSDDNTPVNGSVQIDVTVGNFNNIVLTQYSINWDPTVFTFGSITNITTDLPDFGSGSIGTPDNATNDGELTISWNEAGTNPQNLADGARLFTINLNTASGSMACDSTEVVLSNDPLDIQVVDQNFTEVNVTSNPGIAKIDGVDCMDNGGGDLIGFVGSMETAAPGSNVCVEVSVMNFADIQSLQSGMTWNPAILSYTGVQNFSGLDGFAESAFNANNAASGEIRFLWTDPTAENPVTLNDGAVIFEICFDVVGSNTQMSDVSFSAIGNFGIEFSDSNGASLDFENTNGKVTVQDEGQPGDFTLEVESVEASMGTTSCVGISTANFDDISSMQFTLSWNPAVMTFNRVQTFNLSGLAGSNFNLVASDKLRLTWNSFDGSGVNIADDVELFEVCFDIIGDCNTQPSSTVNFINDGNIGIEIVRGTTQTPISPLNLISGTVAVAACGVNYQLVSITQPDCNGEAGGSIAVTVDGGSDDCNCIWEDSSGNQVSTGTIGANNCNLLGVVAGTYTFKIECPGQGQIFSTTETIGQPNRIGVSASVDNAACGEGGAINLTVTGGTGAYTYNWSPDQGNVQDPTGLAAGTYAVTVTDENNCDNNASFTVTDDVPALELSSFDVMDATCDNNSDGAISLVVNGGCPDISYSWTDGNGAAIAGNDELTDLAAGTYNVTITDGSNPVQMVTMSFTVDAPAGINVSIASVTPSENGNDGEIVLSVSGGAGSYNYSWNPDVGNTDSPGNLAPGNYSVTVTDANGCEASLENINVPSGGPILSNVVGENVACFGETSGAITGELTSSAFPVTLVLSGAATASLNLTASGAFTFDNLGVGMYTVTATDADGATNAVSVTIDQPDILSVAVDANKASAQGVSDASIILTVTGGTGPFTYAWSNGATTSSLVNIPGGIYTVLVRDANGCEFMIQGINVTSGPDVGCYLSNSVMTPNSDGKNDVLVITCASDFPSSLEVYDRVGARVFNTDIYNSDWGGTANDGDELPEGAYMWVLQIDFGQGRRELRTGTVTLLREY